MSNEYEVAAEAAYAAGAGAQKTANAGRSSDTPWDDKKRYGLKILKNIEIQCTDERFREVRRASWFVTVSAYPDLHDRFEAAFNSNAAITSFVAAGAYINFDKSRREIEDFVSSLKDLDNYCDLIGHALSPSRFSTTCCFGKSGNTRNMEDHPLGNLKYSKNFLEIVFTRLPLFVHTFKSKPAHGVDATWFIGASAFFYGAVGVDCNKQNIRLPARNVDNNRLKKDQDMFDVEIVRLFELLHNSRKIKSENYRNNQAQKTQYFQQSISHLCSRDAGDSFNLLNNGNGSQNNHMFCNNRNDGNSTGGSNRRQRNNQQQLPSPPSNSKRKVLFQGYDEEEEDNNNVDVFGNSLEGKNDYGMQKMMMMSGGGRNKSDEFF